MPMGTTRQRGEAMRPVVKRILYLGKLTSGTKKVLADGKGKQFYDISERQEQIATMENLCFFCDTYLWIARR